MERDILDVKEIAEYLRFSTKKVYQLIKGNKIPYKRIGGQYRFIKSEIDKWVMQYSSESIVKNNEYMVAEEAGPKALLEKAAGIKDKLKKNLYIMAVISRELEKHGLKPVIVGGFAVEFYTTGGYNTGDIDLVFSDNKLLGSVLESYSFIKEGRHWIHKELDVYIEAPGSGLTQGEAEHISEVSIEGMKVYVLGIEDLIIDRLNALVHWNSQDEANWIKELLVLNGDKLDWEYLTRRSKEEKTAPALEKLKEEIKNAENKL